MRALGKVPLAAALLLSLSFAGCLGGPAPDPAAPTDTTDLEESFDLDVQDEAPGRDSGRTSWYLLQTEARPGGSVVAFPWTVPRGTLGVEVVPLVPDAARSDLARWGLLQFRTAQDQAVLSGGYLSPTVDVVQRDGPTDTTRETRTPAVRPFWMPVAARGGERIAFVIAAQAPREVPFGLAIRPLLGGDVQNGSVVPGPEAFFAQRETDTGVRLQPIGRATGFEVPAYLDINDVNGTGFEASTAALSVRDRLPTNTDPRPHATLRDVTLVSDFAVDAGWGLALGAYDHRYGGGTWSVDARMHDHRIQRQGPQTTPVGPTEDLFGQPLFIITGEGPGKAHVEFSVRTANANVQESLALFQVELGTMLTELLGGQGVSLTFTVDGDGVPTRPLRLDGRDLVVPLAGGGQLRVAGMGR